MRFRPYKVWSVRMNAKISETVKAKKLGLGWDQRETGI